MSSSVSNVTHHSVEYPRPVDGERQRVLFYCQSSLGIGHTVRSLRLAGALGDAFDVCFLDGSEKNAHRVYPENIDVVNLPAIVSNSSFTTLRAGRAGESLEETLVRRQALMMSTFKRFAPDIFIVELYPFGRRFFGAELKPLLRLARQQCIRTVSSVRDILVKNKNQAIYEAKVVELMNRYFDTLLIHGDPAFIQLDEFFSRLDDIDCDIRYTGYVSPVHGRSFVSPVGGVSPQNEIVVSIGGGRFGHELAFAVVRAAPLLAKMLPHTITLYTGLYCPEGVVERLRTLSRNAPNVVLSSFTDNLHERLAQASLSISLGGYNTTMDVLVSGVPALMMPCLNVDGMDQSVRLEKLAEMNVINLIEPCDLEPHRLAAKVVDALNRPRRELDVDLNGVVNTVNIISDIVRKKSSAVSL